MEEKIVFFPYINKVKRLYIIVLEWVGETLKPHFSIKAMASSCLLTPISSPKIDKKTVEPSFCYYSAVLHLDSS
jgi:hypothetical protein